MPTSVFAIGATLDDQHVQRTSASYATITTAAFVRSTNVASTRVARGLIATNYVTRNLLLSFDTSGTPQVSGVAIPDTATITSATLDLVADTTAANRGSVNALSLVAEYYAWDGASQTDWTTGATNNAHAGTDIESNKNVANFSLALQNLVNINLAGTTRLRLAVTQLAADAAPTGANELVFFTWDDATNTEPRLTVNWTDGPSAPTGLTVTVVP